VSSIDFIKNEHHENKRNGRELAARLKRKYTLRQACTTYARAPHARSFLAAHESFLSCRK